MPAIKSFLARSTPVPAASKTDLPVQQNGRVGAARVLIAGVGYSQLRDNSLGPILIAELKKLDWPEGIEVEDLSYGPIGVMHSLDEQPPYDKIIFLAAVSRGRRPGGLYCYAWNHELPPPDEIQARVAEAVMGVISLDNLLVIATYFKKLPADVWVIEVEPADESWGDGLTPQVEAAIPAIVEKIQQEVGGS
jgi:hydrogenase maturation protease